MVVTHILPLAVAEPAILTNRYSFSTDGCVTGEANRHVHKGSLQYVKLNRTYPETTTDHSPVDSTAVNWL